MPAKYQVEEVSWQGFCSGPTGAPANSTRYLGHTTFNAAENFVYSVIPREGIISRLHVRSNVAPGVGETFIYTIMINGAPVIVTCTIADAALASFDIVNEVAVNAGDTISIRLVTSLNAAVTVHHLGYQFRR